MKTKSAQRIQFELACMRIAYRLRPNDFNHLRTSSAPTRLRTGLIRRIDPWQLLAVITLSAIITILLISIFI